MKSVTICGDLAISFKTSMLSESCRCVLNGAGQHSVVLAWTLPWYLVRVSKVSMMLQVSAGFSN